MPIKLIIRTVSKNNMTKTKKEKKIINVSLYIELLRLAKVMF